MACLQKKMNAWLYFIIYLQKELRHITLDFGLFEIREVLLYKQTFIKCYLNFLKYKSNNMKYSGKNQKI